MSEQTILKRFLWPQNLSEQYHKQNQEDITMKTILTAIVLFTSVSLFGANMPGINAVATTDGHIYTLEKLTYGLNNYLIGKTEDGQKITFKYNEIKRFYKDGVLYEKVCTKKIEGCNDDMFLPVAARRNNVVAYQQEIMDARGHIEVVWHVFVDGDYSMTTNEHNEDFIKDFFACK